MTLTQTQEIKLSRIEDYIGVYVGNLVDFPTMTVLSRGMFGNSTAINEIKPNAIDLIKSTIKLAEKQKWDFGDLDSTNYKNSIFD